MGWYEEVEAMSVQMFELIVRALEITGYSESDQFFDDKRSMLVFVGANFHWADRYVEKWDGYGP